MTSKGGDTQTVPHGSGELGVDSVRGFRIEVVDGPGKGTSWTSDDDSCTIGSHQLCDVTIDDPTVSRFHCEIRVDPSGIRVRDSGSRNGTLLDGVRISDAFMRSGSVLRLGRSVVRFELAARSNKLAVSERSSFGSLHGGSVAMRRIFSLLERAASASATTLLEGETGTGKSAAARAIHAASDRAGGPFVMLDCGAIPPTLLESELFGHEKGSFTGAEVRRVGAFEEADGGVLFLDEIGELSPDLQPKLLGVLENRKVRRIGGQGAIGVDVRVIAATNRDLRKEINEGRFRSDLYFRLAVIRIEMPPLRQRPDDIPEIAAKLLADLGAGDAEIAAMMGPEMLAQLGRSAWPGNVRELKNYLERCLVFEEVMPLEQLDISAPAGGVDISRPFTDARKRAIAEFERAYLTEILTAHNQRVIDAATAAGIDRTHFYRLLRRHKLALGD